MSAATQTKLSAMHETARAKVRAAAGADGFWKDVEADVEAIALAKASGLSPVNENLLGFALMLGYERRRLRGEAV